MKFLSNHIRYVPSLTPFSDEEIAVKKLAWGHMAIP